MKCRFYLLLLALTGCGYSMKGSQLAEQYTTLSIPYVKGDINGQFTDALIRAMGETGQFALVYSGAALRMDGKIVSDRFTQVGYQYDRPPTKYNIQKTRLVPNEERRELAVEITLVDTTTDKVVFGPQVVKADVDYDFSIADAIQEQAVPGTDTSILSYSLGQLDTVEGAREAALVPLQQVLAQKIARGLLAVEEVP